MSVPTASGTTWAEITPELFSQVVERTEVELRLCEEHLPVSVHPIGHREDAFYQFKIITVGELSVGKSMMLQYFTKPLEERLDMLASTLTPSIDIGSRFMTVDGESVKTVLWDTAGEESFRTMIRPFYRDTNGVFLVYSIAERRSFEQCTSWVTELRRNVDENVPIMLIGNQVDRAAERAIRYDEARAFAARHGFLFAEISGKQGIDVDYAFKKLVNEIFGRLKDRNNLERHRRGGQGVGAANIVLEAPEQGGESSQGPSASRQGQGGTRSGCAC
ncbi:Ras small GTPase family Ras protein [Ceratobasidium theobromae]|uniref:Ras small GTPase family Ras protein n=1 Tax=Ceratobasidium theobromae TaxID=1582974 RepID=A0A5N5QKF2_9AGAM|nr:Ras small GTPase family Ras protein [Ceratobasidium theobromae]